MASLMGWMVTLCLTDPGARYGCPGSLKVASMGRETHMRTYQKQAPPSMMSRHLAIPCQFPAVIQESARKVLIFLESAPDMERIFCFFPAGREFLDAPHSLLAA